MSGIHCIELRLFNLIYIPVRKTWNDFFTYSAFSKGFQVPKFCKVVTWFYGFPIQGHLQTWLFAKNSLSWGLVNVAKYSTSSRQTAKYFHADFICLWYFCPKLLYLEIWSQDLEVILFGRTFAPWKVLLVIVVKWPYQLGIWFFFLICKTHHEINNQTQ